MEKTNAETNGVGTTNVYVNLARTGLWRLFPFLILYSIGLSILIPLTPTLMTNGFASLAAGSKIDCQDFTPETSPIECRDAHATVTIWGAWSGFIQGTFVAFLSAPTVGFLSDTYGRKPFMVAGAALMLVPTMALVLNVVNDLPIYWYYPASILSSAASSYNMCLTAVGDLMPQHHRAACVGLITASFSVGILLGPLLGGYLVLTTALWTAVALLILSLMALVLLVQESAPAARAAAESLRRNRNAIPEKTAEAAATSTTNGTAAAAAGARENGIGGACAVTADTVNSTPRGRCGLSSCSSTAGNHLTSILEDGCTSPHLEGAADVETNSQAAGGSGPTTREESPGTESESTSQPKEAGDGRGKAAWLRGWAVIWRDPFYLKLTVICVTMTAVIDGSLDLLFQFLQLTLGFKTKDQANLMEVAAVAGLVVKTALLAPLNAFLGDRLLLIFGLAAFCVEYVILASIGAAPPPVSTVIGVAAAGFRSLKTLAFIGVAISTLGAVCWPVTVALQTSRVKPEDRGAVQGAIQGVVSLLSGFGPLVFAFAFKLLSASTADERRIGRWKLPYFPGAVWLLALVATAFVMAVTWTLDDGKAAGQDDHRGNNEDEVGGRRLDEVVDEDVVIRRRSDREVPGSPGAGDSVPV